MTNYRKNIVYKKHSKNSEITLSAKIALSFSCIIVMLFSLVGQAQAIELKIAAITPNGSTWMKKLKEGAKDIAQKTQGRVTFKFYPGGVMGEDKTVLRKMKVGQLHGGVFSNGTINNIYPGSQVYNQVLKFNSYNEIDHIRPKIDPLIIAGLKDKGLTTLGLSELGFAYLMSTQPIATIEDLQKQKAWVPENNHTAAEALKAFSVIPTPLPIRDVLVSLQTGMINVVAGSPVGAITLQWHTQIKYVTDLPIAYVYGAVLVSNRVMKKISLDDQKIIKQTMGRIAAEMDSLTRKDNFAAIEAIKNQGVKWIKPSDETISHLKTMIKSANDNLMKSGNMDKDIVDRLDGALTEFRKNAIAIK